MKIPTDEIEKDIDAQFLAKFKTREILDELLLLREQIREAYEQQVLDMVSRDFNKTKIHFIVKSVDSEEATLLETLESDIEDFFFGVKVIVETEE